MALAPCKTLFLATISHTELEPSACLIIDANGQDDVSFCLGCGQAIDWSEWEDEDEQI
jgi:hypothetical protein